MYISIETTFWNLKDDIWIFIDFFVTQKRFVTQKLSGLKSLKVSGWVL